MARRLQIIDDLVRKDHYHLSESDRCIFFGEYTARRPYGFSQTNQLIGNLKKKVDRKGQPDWHYKQEAIERVALIFSRGLKKEFLAQATLVPMPPSKVKGDPEYDDRMLQIAQKMGQGLDIREMLSMKKSVVASHSREDRPTPDDLYDLMKIEAAVAKPKPSIVIILDDVLTAGSHFVAAKRHIEENYPEAKVIGLFVARRILETDDFDDIGGV